MGPTPSWCSTSRCWFADGTSDRDRYSNLSGIVVVDIDHELAVERLVKNRGFSAEDARARIANQASRADRRAVADIVIDNSGDLEGLEQQVDDAWAWMESLPHLTSDDAAPEDTVPPTR